MELPDMMSAKCSDLLTPSPLYALGSDSYYKIHASFRNYVCFSITAPPSDADFIS